MLFKIFCETNKGPQDLEDRLNDFFQDKDDIQILSINSVIEKVEGIDYCNIIVCYKENAK